MTKKKPRRLSSSQMIIFGFAALVFAGAVLLALPVSSASGQWTSFLDTLFTATSAVCVTGLITVDTATTWSLFGKIILLILIQIGGLGIVMAVTTVSLYSGRKIGLMQRSTMADSISVDHIGGVLRMTKMILRVTAAIEGIGALLLMFAFIPEFGVIKGTGYALFHSVSAFCNAGFDLMGVKEPFSSLTSYTGNALVNIVVMLLIITGGISFMTWQDIQKHKTKIKMYSMQSKLILTVSAILIVIPAVLFFFMEFSEMPLKERILSSLFQAVTARTAGFNTADLSAMSDSGKLLMCFLMLIGGSPGSTAGGLKTTTIAVALLGTVAVMRNKDEVHCFGRAIDNSILIRAYAIVIIYFTVGLGAGALIARIENVPLTTALFESCSAIGTVGLSLGLTPSLHVVTKLIVILLMFAGRIGTLTLILAVIGTPKNAAEGKLVKENIVVG